MERRALLRSLGAACALGSAAVSGCPRSDTGPDPAAYGGESEWRFDVGGSVDAVAHDHVFGREIGRSRTPDGADGAVFALDAETGRHQWEYGSSGKFSWYSDLVIDDAVYVAHLDDSIGNGSGPLHALEFDGEERWSREDENGVGGPKVADGTVYRGSTGGAVRAFDATDGSVDWRVENIGETAAVVEVADTVYVASDRIVGLDPADGSVLWRYGDGGADVSDVDVVDDVAYAGFADRVVAVVDGTEQWAVEVDGLVGDVQGDYLVVGFDNSKRVLEVPSGETVWTSEPTYPAIELHGDVAYVGGERVYALDTTDWTERWSSELEGDATAEAVRVVEDRDDGHSVYVPTDDGRLLRFDPAGRRTWDPALEGDVRDFVVRDRVYVGTEANVSALDPSATTTTE